MKPQGRSRSSNSSKQLRFASIADKPTASNASSKPLKGQPLDFDILPVGNIRQVDEKKSVLLRPTKKSRVVDGNVVIIRVSRVNLSRIGKLYNTIYNRIGRDPMLNNVELYDRLNITSLIINNQKLNMSIITNYPPLIFEFGDEVEIKDITVINTSKISIVNRFIFVNLVADPESAIIHPKNGLIIWDIEKNTPKKSSSSVSFKIDHQDNLSNLDLNITLKLELAMELNNQKRVLSSTSCNLLVKYPIKLSSLDSYYAILENKILSLRISLEPSIYNERDYQIQVLDLDQKDIIFQRGKVLDFSWKFPSFAESVDEKNFLIKLLLADKQNQQKIMRCIEEKRITIQASKEYRPNNSGYVLVYNSKSSKNIILEFEKKLKQLTGRPIDLFNLSIPQSIDLKRVLQNNNNSKVVVLPGYDPEIIKPLKEFARNGGTTVLFVDIKNPDAIKSLDSLLSIKSGTGSVEYQSICSLPFTEKLNKALSDRSFDDVLFESIASDLENERATFAKAWSYFFSLYHLNFELQLSKLNELVRVLEDNKSSLAPLDCSKLLVKRLIARVQYQVEYHTSFWTWFLNFFIPQTNEQIKIGTQKLSDRALRAISSDDDGLQSLRIQVENIKTDLRNIKLSSQWFCGFFKGYQDRPTGVGDLKTPTNS